MLLQKIIKGIDVISIKIQSERVKSIIMVLNLLLFIKISVVSIGTNPTFKAKLVP